MDTLKDINNVLRKSAKRGSARFLNSYLEREAEVLNLLSRLNGIKSEIYIKNIDNELKNFVRFSSLFSDITTINTTPSSSSDTQITLFNSESEQFKERKITIPRKYIHETGSDPKRFLPCYYHRNDQEIRSLFLDFRPLLEAERLIIRPLRGLYVSFPELKKGNLYYVDPNTSDDHWYVNEKQNDDFITIDNGLHLNSCKALFDATVPFFSDIDFSILCKILKDETDILSSFREDLKKVVQQSGTDKIISNELSRDLLTPRIQKIEKKFKKIQGKHRLGVGVAVGSFVLTFSLAYLSGENILDALKASSVPGAIGAILLSNSDYGNKVDELKEDPVYLLWQIKRNK